MQIKEEIGLSFLKCFFRMSDKEIKDNLKYLFEDYVSYTNDSAIFSDLSIVEKTIVNEKINKIEIYAIDRIIITSSGIEYFITETITSSINIEFTKNFKLKSNKEI